jgi:hypothetical protein
MSWGLEFMLFLAGVWVLVIAVCFAASHDKEKANGKKSNR